MRTKIRIGKDPIETLRTDPAAREALALLAWAAAERNTLLDSRLAGKVRGKAYGGSVSELEPSVRRIQEALEQLHREREWPGEVPCVGFLIVNPQQRPSEEIYLLSHNLVALRGRSEREQLACFRHQLEKLYGYNYWYEFLAEFGLGGWWDSLAKWQERRAAPEEIAEIREEDEDEPDGTDEMLREWNLKQLKRMLADVTRTQKAYVRIRGKILARDKAMVKLIKALRGYRCQLCGWKLERPGGGYYIEGAHIVEKRAEGKETPDNILVLCPNHHKRFDLGALEILEHTEKHLVVRLDGQEFEADLSIE
jgi:hypothetical protein